MFEGLSSPDWGLLVLRIGIALVFFSHGWPKLNPKSEIKGITGVADFFQKMNIPYPKLSAWIVGLLEMWAQLPLL